ncbi:MAG: ABC transporter permease [Verrucomicrobia bacterium]|nr:ABC transporter permease [Verrucomicrobiota bacterium]
MNSFSIHRLWAVVIKEFIQMRRDRLTFGMMVGVPLLQLTLFGFAINSNPKNLPTAVVLGDNSPCVQTLLQGMRNSGYFEIRGQLGAGAAREALQLGSVQFVLTIPPDFSRSLLRGDRPEILLEADATDPAATGNAISTVEELVRSVWSRDLTGPLAGLSGKPGPVNLIVHAKFNPEAITQYNIVPGLMGVVLTMTMVMITALAITRERERGTMENLLSMPSQPIEVMVGKILPYILVGYIQVALILAAAAVVFHVPMMGSLPLLLGASFVFIAANLAVGVTFSSVATNQLQAMQMSFFFFLPSLLLSGFMFPFRGMPVWAQYLGEAFPLTHFLRIVRGILLKGNGLSPTLLELGPIAVFLVVALVVGVGRYRRTLD